MLQLQIVPALFAHRNQDMGAVALDGNTGLNSPAESSVWEKTYGQHHHCQCRTLPLPRSLVPSFIGTSIHSIIQCDDHIRKDLHTSVVLSVRWDHHVPWDRRGQDERVGCVGTVYDVNQGCGSTRARYQCGSKSCSSQAPSVRISTEFATRLFRVYDRQLSGTCHDGANLHERETRGHHDVQWCRTGRAPRAHEASTWTSRRSFEVSTKFRGGCWVISFTWS